MNAVQAYPLQWPAHQPRAKYRRSAKFGSHSIGRAVEEVLYQVRQMDGRSVTISSNLALRNDGLPKSGQAQPADTGVAVYFWVNNLPLVFARDAWTRVEHNLWAVAKHLEALRGQQRWGVGSLEQAYKGYQLPASTAPNPTSWWEVLGVTADAKPEEVKASYLRLVKLHHPDVGGDAERMARINRAYQESKSQGRAL